MDLPWIGLGTWDLRGEECTRVVEKALELGYRHIDTAHVYDNHEQIGKAIKGFNRHKLFITSKIAFSQQVDPEKPEESVHRAIEETLAELGTNYLDLYLIHAPNPDFPRDRIYLVLEKLKEQKLARHVGVSNYGIEHLETLVSSKHIPFANQVEFHPYLYQKELLDYCLTHQIRLIAYRPFGKGKLLQEEPLFQRIGEGYHKSGAQVVLRWLYQKGIPVIPKARSEKHLKENLEILDFALSKEQMDQLDKLSRDKRYCSMQAAF